MAIGSLTNGGQGCYKELPNSVRVVEHFNRLSARTDAAGLLALLAGWQTPILLPRPCQQTPIRPRQRHFARRRYSGTDSPAGADTAIYGWRLTPPPPIECR